MAKNSQLGLYSCISFSSCPDLGLSFLVWVRPCLRPATESGAARPLLIIWPRPGPYYYPSTTLAWPVCNQGQVCSLGQVCKYLAIHIRDIPPHLYDRYAISRTGLVLYQLYHLLIFLCLLRLKSHHMKERIMMVTVELDSGDCLPTRQ